MIFSHERAQKTANVLYIVFTVFYWLSIVLLVVVSLGFLVQFILPKTLFQISAKDFNFSFDNTIYFQSDLAESINIQGFLQKFSFFAIPLMFMLVVGLKHMRLILKSVKEGNPFCEANVKSLSIIGLDLILAAFVVSLAENVLFNHLLNLLSIRNITMNYSANVPYLLAGILVILLAGIFNYGRFLKSEYDATV